jgi:hypothetical protein
MVFLMNEIPKEDKYRTIRTVRYVSASFLKGRNLLFFLVFISFKLFCEQIVYDYFIATPIL